LIHNLTTASLRAIWSHPRAPKWQQLSAPGV